MVSRISQVEPPDRDVTYYRSFSGQSIGYGWLERLWMRLAVQIIC